MKKSNKSLLVLVLIMLIFFGCTNKNKNVINLGSIQVLTGQMSKYGKTLQAALKAQLDIINEERTKEDLPLISITFEDDKLDPKTGVTCLEQLIQTKKPMVVFGALGSSVTLAIAPVANKNKIVLISPASGAPAITDAGDYIFRTCPSDLYEAKTIAQYYEKNYKSKSIAILYINNDYGNGLKNAFIGNLKNKPETLLELGFTQGQTDFKTEFAKIKEQGIKVIYLVGYEEMINIYKQAKELKVNCKWLGNNQMNDPSMLSKFGTTADSTIFPGHQFDLDSIKKTDSVFYKKYLKYSGGIDLDVFAAYGVDALMAVNYVMLQGAKSGEEIKDALYKLKDFKGMTGKFDFDKNGDPQRILNLYQIQNGKMIKIN